MRICHCHPELTQLAEMFERLKERKLELIKETKLKLSKQKIYSITVVFPFYMCNTIFFSPNFKKNGDKFSQLKMRGCF